MATYRDGRQAQIGDVVCGRGHSVGYDLTGVVVRIGRDKGDQGIVVAHCGVRTRIAQAGRGEVLAIAELECGEAWAFELLVPAPPKLRVTRLGS